MKKSNFLIIIILILLAICLFIKISSNTEFQSGNNIKSLQNTSISANHEILPEDDDLKILLQYMSYLNAKNDINMQEATYENIKLDISSYYVDSFSYGDLGLLSYNKDDIHVAIKELFGETITAPISKSINGLIYDENIDAYRYEYGGDSVCSSYLIKIESQVYSNDIYEVTFIYAYPSEGDLLDDNIDEYDCFRTTAKIKINENYKYSKYQLQNKDSISSTPAGKVKDFK